MAEDMGPLESEINQIIRVHLSSIPAIQNAFKEGRAASPTYADLTSDNVEDSILESLEIAGASINALREAVIRIARELDNHSSS
jgi:hypothetical protein